MNNLFFLPSSYSFTFLDVNSTAILAQTNITLLVIIQYICGSSYKFLSKTKVPNGNSGLSGTRQTDWLMRCSLYAICVRETHSAGQVRFV